MRRLLLVGVLGLAILGAAVAASFFLKPKAPDIASDAMAQQPAFDLAPASSTKVIVSSAPRTPPAGAAEYRNTSYGLSLFYPKDLSVSVTDDGGGAATIVFQNTESIQGFQIFIVPYAGAQVTEQRFQEDEPSGIRDDVTEGLIDGAPAAAFYSTDPRLGDTYEVWFIHGGYLYEATTLKSLDTWFQPIMQTWEFI